MPTPSPCEVTGAMPTITRGRFRRGLLPSPTSFYRRELGELRREDSRGWAKPKAGCPFHASESKTSFAVNLRTGQFNCFNCGASGDVIAFIRLRYGLNFKEACQRLGAWDDALQIDKVIIHELETERQRQEQERQSAREREHAELIRARAWLHCLVGIQRDSSARLTELREGDEAEIHWHILSLLVDEIREAETAYDSAAGLTS